MRSALRPALRPVLTALARVIATDRRAVVLANRKAEILLANAAASRLGLSRATLTARLDWAGLCAQTDRAGSAALSWQHEAQHFDGELVLVPLGGTQGAALQGYLLRLAESDQESTWLRNRARAAALMRVAHDLRTPIQSLLASADTLIRGTGSAAERAPELAPELATELAGMRRAAALSLDHIGNVLAVIRGESAGGGSQPDEDFRIGDELANLVAMVAPLARAHATEVSLAIDAPEGLTLHGPLRFVRALCQNLIDNSVNHGGGRVAVTLRCAPLDAEQPPDQAADQPSDQAGPEAAGQMRRQTGRQMGNHGAGSPRRGAAGRPWRITLEIRDEGGGLSDTAKARLSEALGTAATEPTAGITAGTAAGETGGGAGGETGGGAGGTATDATLAASAGATRPSAGMNVLAHALRQLGGQMVIQDLGRDGQPMRPPLEATPMEAPTGLGRNPGPKIGTETGPAAPQPQPQAPQRTGRVIGTLFEVSFSLPRAPELPQPEAQSQDLAQDLPPHQRGNSALPAGTAEGKTRAGLSGRHILLVEDSPSSRDWLAHLLRSHGAEITAAGSGPEALALMSRAGLTRPVDLILSDVTLPRMSGIELTALLRAGNGAAAQAWTGPIVGLTAHADDRIRAACLEAGMNKILEKPVQPATLCAILAAILQGNALAAAAGRALPPLPDPKTTAPISAQTLADMTEHMGAGPALAFITRAMEEAQIVHDELQQEGPGPDTGRRIHAATGAAGLTGLVEIERQLRALEQAAETASPALPTLLGALELALLQARSFAESLQT